LTTLREQGLIFFICGGPLVLRQLGVCSFFEHFAAGKARKMLLISTCLEKASSHPILLLDLLETINYPNLRSFEHFYVFSLEIKEVITSPSPIPMIIDATKNRGEAFRNMNPTPTPISVVPPIAHGLLSLFLLALSIGPPSSPHNDIGCGTFMVDYPFPVVKVLSQRFGQEIRVS
jgi:hypothetical protein